MIWYYSSQEPVLRDGRPPRSGLALQHEYPLVWPRRLMRSPGRSQKSFVILHDASQTLSCLSSWRMGVSSFYFILYYWFLFPFQVGLGGSQDYFFITVLECNTWVVFCMKWERLKRQGRLNFLDSLNCWTLGLPFLPTALRLFPFHSVITRQRGWHQAHWIILFCVGFWEMSLTPLFFSLLPSLFFSRTLLFDVAEANLRSFSLWFLF